MPAVRWGVIGLPVQDLDRSEGREHSFLVGADDQVSPVDRCCIGCDHLRSLLFVVGM